MKFPQEIMDFYGLRSGPQTRIYYAGISMKPYRNTYENDLDELIRGMEGELIPPPQKIGITLSSQIAAQRSDIDTVVGDLSKLHFDGILFLPRPYTWAQHSYKHLNGFLASLIERTEMGLIAFHLDADLSEEQIMFLLRFVCTELGYNAERINSPNLTASTHLLIRN